MIPTDDDTLDGFAVLAKRLREALAGKDPEIQGAALADMVSMWVAGHPPFVREQVLESWLEVMRRLIEVNDKIMFGDKGHPQKMQ